MGCCLRFVRCGLVSIPLFAAIFMIAALQSAARADVSVNSLDMGWYDKLGGRDLGNKNYIAGEVIDITTQSPMRNFFVFDVPAGPSIPAARLRLFNPSSPNPGYQSADPTETYTLFDVTTAIASLRGQGGVAAYEDLGTGTIFGSVVASAADNGKFISIDLNPDALAALDAARGGQFAVGGAITTIATSPSRRTQCLFAWTPQAAVPGNTTLEIVVPEPATPTALALLAGTALLRRRRPQRSGRLSQDPIKQ